MPTSKLVAVRCPSCGAPIKIGDTGGTCQYCNTIVERPRLTERFRENAPARAAAPPPQPTAVASQAPARPRPRRRGGARIWLLLLLIGSGYAYYRYDPKQPIALPKLITDTISVVTPNVPTLPAERIADMIAVSPADTPTTEMIAYLYEDENHFSVGVVDGVSGALRWKSAPLSKDARAGSVAVGANTLFVSDKSRLHALRLADGTPLWQATLAADVAEDCEGCLAVVGERVVALQKDGSLYAYDAHSGQLAWQTQLDDSPRRLPRMGDTLLAIHANPKERGSQFRLIKASDGSSIGQITPHCTGDISIYDAVFNPTDPLLLADDGKTFYVMFGTINTCAQRWTIGNPAPDWEMWLDGSIMTYALDTHRVKLVGDRLLLSTDDTVTMIETATGKTRRTFQAERHKITPLFARDGTLVVDATPTWDSNKHTLLGVDLSSGEQRWSHDVQAKEWRGNQLFGEWDAQLTSAGVLVVEAAEDEHQLIVDRLDLKTGASIGRQITKLPAGGSQVFWDVFWSDRTAWLRIGNITYVLDLASGNIVGQMN